MTKQVGVEEPIFIRTDDCQGNPRRFYSCTAWNSDGRCVGASADTAAEALEQATAKFNAREEYLKSHPIDKLKSIASKKSLCHNDIEEAIRVISQIILERS